MHDKADLTYAEQDKLDEWLNWTVGQDVDPVTVTNELNYKATKLKSDENIWHFYIGSYNRVFYL